MLHDLRFALRLVRRYPGFAAAVVATLALGIGATTTIFSVVDAALLRTVPHPEPDRLVIAYTTYRDFGHSSTSLPDFLDWRDGMRGRAELAAVSNASFNITGDGVPERAQGAAVTANYFEVLRATPALGRAFTPDEERGRAPRVAMLSHAYWQRAFAGDPRVVGRTIRLNDVPRTIVGVAPPELALPARAELFIPLRTDTTLARRNEFLTVLGRLEGGTTVEGAQVALNVVAARLRQLYPESNGPRLSVEVRALRDHIVGEARPALLVIAGAVGLVLLVACANVANLLLVRAVAREREMAVRSALGAGRARVLRQLLVESLVLALAGGALGILLASVTVAALRAAAIEGLPRLGAIGVDGRVLAFAIVLSAGTGLLFGVAPALRLARTEVQGTLRSGGRGVAGAAGAARLRAALVVGEVALSVVLLVGTGLLVRSFLEMQRVPTGFDAEGVLTARATLPRSRYPDEYVQVPAFWAGVLDRVRSAPGVRSAAAASFLPMTGSPYYTFTIEGRTPPPDAGEDVQTFVVSEDYFTTMGIPVLRGRAITREDLATAPRVAVINAEAARRFFPGRDPIGARITVTDSTEFMTIVGVVADVAQEGVTARRYPQLYGAAAQFAQRAMFVAVRGTGAPEPYAAAIRQAVAELDPQLPVYDVLAMRGRVAADLARPRLTATLVALFGGAALLLAAIGIYGVVAHGVVQRTRELGIRLALGARTQDVVRMVIRQGMAPVALGAALGLAAAVAAARAARGLLYGVSAVDPLSFVLAPLFLAAVALLASWLPGRRAGRVAPAEALRAE